MPGKKDPGPSIKNKETYEALRDKGASKGKAARISNAQADPSRHTSEKGGHSPPYEDWSKDDLDKKAADIGIEGHGGMNKAELIDALRNH